MSTLTIQPCGIDADVNDANANTNYGTSVDLHLGADVTNGVYHSFLRFDFTSLPANSTISNATFSMYYYDKGVDSVGRTYWTKELNNTGWTEGGVTWNKTDGVGSWANPGGDVIDTNKASTTVPADYGWMSWNITEMIKHFQVDSGKIANLYTEDGSIGVFRSHFHSSEYTDDTSLCPKLVITYEMGSTSPSVSPSVSSSTSPSQSPSLSPSTSPSLSPSTSPSPSLSPSQSPSVSPSPSESPSGSLSPSNSPSLSPSTSPSSSPSLSPSTSTSSSPSESPSESPSVSPSWEYDEKHDAEWDYETKHETTWSNPDKNSTTWNYPDRHGA
jgi:hypothetical protein